MGLGATLIAVITLLFPGPTLGGDIPPALRAAFDTRFQPGRTYAVVQKQWIPATALSERELDAIDVISGGWKRSTGFGDAGTGGGEITAWLSRGEVVELVAIHYKDNRIDLILRSVKTYEVLRKGKTRVEQVQTRFKFFFPFPLSSADDLPRVVDYIEPYLRDFPTLLEAQAFADDLTAPAHVAPRSESSPQAPRLIVLDQTPEQVKAILGQPEKIVDLGSKLIYYYSDMIITFMNGRLTDVQQR